VNVTPDTQETIFTGKLLNQQCQSTKGQKWSFEI